MNKVVTSKSEVLQVSRELIQKSGWSAISIRAVASACDVSVGTIYNYFDSKSDLVSAAIESVWCDIFHDSENAEQFGDTLSCIKWLYERIEYGNKVYPGFFSLHSSIFASLEKKDAVLLMKKTWDHILKGLCMVLRADPNIRCDAFNKDFSPEKFAEMIFSLVLSALMKQDYDPSALLQMVQRCLY